jgi:peptidylprolyl isomerase
MSRTDRHAAWLLAPALLLLSGCQKPAGDTTEKTNVGTVATPAPTVATSGPGEMKTTATGLQYQDLVVGSGPRPIIGQSLQLYYTGRLEEGGKPFDSGVFNFNPVKDKTIKGWNLGILGDAEIEPMRIGGRRKLIIPPNLGYGGMESGPVPPNSTLIFEIELKRTLDNQNPLTKPNNGPLR